MLITFQKEFQTLKDSWMRKQVTDQVTPSRPFKETPSEKWCRLATNRAKRLKEALVTYQLTPNILNEMMVKHHFKLLTNLGISTTYAVYQPIADVIMDDILKSLDTSNLNVI